jgi:hypothetical protein
VNYNGPPDLKLDPPTILSVNSSGKAVQFTYFGAVGATRYELYRSFNGSSYTLIKSDIVELLDDGDSVMIDDTDTALSKLTCSQFIFYQMISVCDNPKVASSPVNFQVFISIDKEPENCKIKFTTTNEYRESSSLSIGLLVGITGGIVAIIFTAVAVLYKRELRKKHLILQALPASPSFDFKNSLNDPVSQTFALGRKRKYVHMMIYCILNILHFM